ncbi:hypothetical protein PTKU64_25380 [Paraburkholderia terrae]|uniref:Uncharacterized protein n=1 Tax=Paraburkholderia terrae TaxID=311230 RepID=A0ABM7TV88_9BURK|nr:hypothetical protein PTKU64_25380 [Paraburkholderia terrae]
MGSDGFGRGYAFAEYRLERSEKFRRKGAAHGGGRHGMVHLRLLLANILMVDAHFTPIDRWRGVMLADRRGKG